jgi:uncharacterized protein YqfA (UPF0365 family)
MNNDRRTDYQNSRALYVMKIIAMSFAILAVVVFVTVTLFKWISELNEKVKKSQTHIAKISARLNRLRRARIKHILKLRRAQKKEAKKKLKQKKGNYEAEEMNDNENENAINGFDNFIGDNNSEDDDDINEIDEYLREEMMEDIEYK